MRLLRTLLATALALAAFGQGSAFSQEPPAVGGVGRPPIRRPTTSPYLNLLRRDGRPNLTLDYYGTVRPQQEFRSAISRQSRSLDRLQSQVDEQGALLRSQNSQLGPTGHQVQFLSFGAYFGSFGR